MNGPLKIALAGNPNSGKSSLFNLLTGMRQKVGNFPGVTVERKQGKISLGGKEAILIDLPGLYSLYSHAEDERIASEVLRSPGHPDHPDVVVLVADATNLRRSLFLGSEMMDLGLPVVVAVNMVDLLPTEKVRYDVKKLSAVLGVEMVEISALKNTGLEALKAALMRQPKAAAQPFFRIPDAMRPALEILSPAKQANYGAWMTLLRPDLDPSVPSAKIEEARALAGIRDPEALQSNETTVRYDRISEILQSCELKQEAVREKFSARLDRWLLHPVFGYVIFLAVLLLIFQAIFAWATVPMDLIDGGFSAAGDWLSGVLPEHFLSDLLVKGIWAGIGGIVVFLPQIAFLFFFIAILEDSGYMSRAVFLMDRFMRPFGFSGRSVIPLAGGMACAVPSIMMARSIPNPKERLITILVTPLMSCSARIPVYVLLIGLLVPAEASWGFFNLQGLVMGGMYLLGFVMALLVAFVIGRFVKQDKRNIFLFELPVYRSPRWKNIGVLVYNKCKTFVWEAGKVILVISVVLWLLSAFGPGDQMDAVRKEYSEKIMAAATDTLAVKQLEKDRDSRLLETSYAGKLGHAIEPVIRPLGFDWKIGISLVTSFAAREVFVGTMSTLYSVDEGEEESGGRFARLRTRMMAEVRPGTNEKIYSPGSVMALLIFYAFAMQCMSTLAVTRKETKSWKITAFMLVYLTVLAWVAAFVANSAFS